MLKNPIKIYGLRLLKSIDTIKDGQIKKNHYIFCNTESLLFYFKLYPDFTPVNQTCNVTIKNHL